MLVIAGAVLLANVLYLAGVFDANPLGYYGGSGLGQVTHTGLIGGLPTIDPNIGETSQALGHRAMLDLLHGHVPWWNQYEGTGTPLAGEMAGAALYPFTLFTLMANGQIYERVVFELLSGLATYLLLRRVKVGRVACTAGGIAFALNGTFAWFAHAPINPIVWLPVLLLGLEIAFDASVAGRRGGWWLIAIAAALSLYAGFPETAYLDALLAVLWFLWRCGCATREHLRAFVTKAVSGAVAAGLLAAPILIAFADYESHGFNAHPAGSYAHVHLPASAVPQVLLPYIYGPIFGFNDAKGELSGIWGSVGGFLSLAAVLFGLFGLISPGRRGLRAILLAWIVLALARTYGVPVLDDVLGVPPGMGQIAFFRYASPSVELAVIVLSALGVDALRTQPASRRRGLAVTLVAALAAAAAVVGATPLVDRLIDATHRDYFRPSVIWAAVVLAAGGLAAILPDPRARRLTAAALISLDALALFVLPEFSAPRSVKIDNAPIPYLKSHVGLSRFGSLGPLNPDYGSYYGLRSIVVDDALLPKTFAHYVQRNLDPEVLPLIFTGAQPGPPGAPTPEQELLSHLAGYRQAGVRYILTPPAVKLPLARHEFKIVFRSPTTLIYRLSGASPYFTATQPGCTVKAQNWQSARISCSASTTLVRRETYMPGWTAQVDGHARPLHEYDGVFQAVAVPAGTHKVTFGFEPPRIRWAELAFIIGCLWLIVRPLVGRIRRRATPAGAS